MANYLGNDPPAPQKAVVTTTTANGAARVGPYTDASLTKRNVVSAAAASDLPPPSGSRTLGEIRPVYANDKVESVDNTLGADQNQGVDPPPHAPNSWAIETRAGQSRGRDVYANDGVTGQPFFENQG